MITSPKLFVFNVFAFMAAILFLSSSAMASVVTDDMGFFNSPDVVDFETGFPSGPFSSHTIGNTTFGGPLLAIDNSAPDAKLLQIIGGSIQIDFATDVNRVGFDYETTSALTIEGYDAFNNLLSSSGPHVGAGMGFLGFESATGISKVIVHDGGLEFNIDSFRSEVGMVNPEPMSLVIWSLLVLTVTGSCWWRRRHTT